MQTSNHFEFNLGLNKAVERDGEFYLETEVSDTSLDYHDQHMTEKALDSMQSMLKNGFRETDGSLQKVYLLDNHAATFEMGYATDGKIAKDAQGNLKLSATWQLLKDNPQAMQLFREVAAGTCKKQLSVGGDAVGHAYFNETLGKTVGSLDDVVKLEHVACTRPGKAAVASTGFIGAMLKSIQPLTTAATQENQEIMDQKAFDDLKKSQEDFKTETSKQITELTTLVKSLAPAAPAKTAEQIALEKAAAAGPLTAESLAAALGPILKSNNEELVKSLALTPGPRTNAGVPAGAAPMQKSTEDTIAEALKNAETQKVATSADLTKKKDALATLETQREIVITKRKALVPFTPAEQIQAETLEKQYSQLRSEIHFAEATGITV